MADALPLVAIFVVKETGFDELTLIIAGANEHDVANGSPEQDMEMLPLKPVPGFTWSEYCAVCPAMTDALVDDCGDAFS